MTVVMVPASSARVRALSHHLLRHLSLLLHLVILLLVLFPLFRPAVASQVTSEKQRARDDRARDDRDNRPGVSGGGSVVLELKTKTRTHEEAGESLLIEERGAWRWRRRQLGVLLGQHNAYANPIANARNLSPRVVSSPLNRPEMESYLSTSVAFGSPPRIFELVVDTGSSLAFVPCSGCKRCGKHMVSASILLVTNYSSDPLANSPSSSSSSSSFLIT